MNLPIVTNCDRCCACCLEQESPPGYIAILNGMDWPDLDDVARVAALPDELKKGLRNYLDAVKRGEHHPNGGECIWLDGIKRRCMHHEHRPSICREFEVGSEPCQEWREMYPDDAS